MSEEDENDVFFPGGAVNAMGKYVVQWYEHGEWKRENWRWHEYESAMRFARIHMERSTVEAAIVEQIKPHRWGSITNDYLFNYNVETTNNTVLYTSDYYVDWEREEKRARLKLKQLKKT